MFLGFDSLQYRPAEARLQASTGSPILVARSEQGDNRSDCFRYSMAEGARRSFANFPKEQSMLKTLIAAVAASLVSVSAHATVFPFTAMLSGANEVGTAGDPDGTGFASLLIDSVTGNVSFDITFSNLSNVVAGHIHAGAFGVNGPVIIPFDIPMGTASSGSFSGSVVDSDALGINPLTAANFYVNLHTNQFTAGAIRGQLVPSQVPEPATVALLLSGAAMVGFTRRRRPR